MKKTLAERYKDVKPVGVYPISNWGGLVILEIEDGGEYAVSAFDWGEGIQNVRSTRIMYSDSGRPHIRRYGVNYYFDQIMRV